MNMSQWRGDARQTECSQVVKAITAVVWGKVKCGIAEYRCGMAIGLRLASEDRVSVMARAWVTVMYFAFAILRNFSQFYTFRIAQIRNG